MAQIKVYATSTCPYCRMLREWLEENKLEYSAVLVDQGDEKIDEMLELSDGHMGVPFSVVTLDDGRVEKIVGFDRLKFEQVLGMVTTVA